MIATRKTELHYLYVLRTAIKIKDGKLVGISC